jgi:hypothetical protein
MKKLFLVTAVICFILNGAIIRTWLAQEASAKEKIEKQDKKTADELALLKSDSK